MAGRRTNLALLGLLATAVVTGAVAYGTGTGWARWPVIAHGISGLGIVVLTPWKSAVVKRARRGGGYDRAAATMLSVLVIITVVSGVLFATAGRGLRYGPLNAMQVHVGAALLTIPFAIHHVVSHRLLPRPSDLSRRNFLKATSLSAVAAVSYGVVEGANRVLSLPGADRRFTGSYETGSMTGRFPTTQWLNDTVPTISPTDWRLSVPVDGAPVELGLAEVDLGTDTVVATLDCTSGWYSTQEWQGMRLDRLLGSIDGESVVVRSATGYQRRFPLSDTSSLVLATRVNGEPLSPGHGAPARLVAPGRRGFWWVKWVTHISVDHRPWWLQSPFPLS